MERTEAFPTAFQAPQLRAPSLAASRTGCAGGGVAPCLIAQTGSRGLLLPALCARFLYGPSIRGDVFTSPFLTNRLFKGKLNFTEKKKMS